MAGVRQIALGAFCFLLIYFAYRAFDHYDLAVLVGGELAILVLGLLASKGLRRYVLTFTGGFALFLIGGEVLFRLLYFGPQGLSLAYRPADYNHPLSGLEYDASTFTHRKPNMEAVFKGHRFTTNDKGFRGRSYSLKKPDNTYRIVLIGASTSMGSGVADDQVASHLLEAKLNAAGLGRQIEVINLSIAGVMTLDMLSILEDVGLSYDPDTILFMANKSRLTNDRTSKKAQTYDGPTRHLYSQGRFEALSAHFFLAQLIKRQRAGKLELPAMFAQRTTGTPIPGAERRAAEIESVDAVRPQMEEHLQRLRELAGDRQVILYLLKPIFRLQDPQPDLAYRTFLRYLAAHYDMDVIDTYDADYSGYTERDLILYPGENHPNATSHSIYAETLYEKLLNMLKEEG